ncbi:MAG: DUF61 family protein [Candidatus Methanomethylicia archaeon]|jgi:uncharacterized protein (UPF0216 family)|nr:DUF61 family protein [Candidatus Methanomethylicia archaeon]
MMEDEDRLTKILWEVELKRLNESLPRVRKPLPLLLEEIEPSYTTVIGERVAFNRAELEDIASLVPKDKQPSISLPILIVKEWGTKKGVYTIQGNESERALINAILKKPIDNRYVYLPDILELSKRIPSLIVFGFQFSSDELIP